METASCLTVTEKRKRRERPQGSGGGGGGWGYISTVCVYACVCKEAVG